MNTLRTSLIILICLGLSACAAYNQGSSGRQHAQQQSANSGATPTGASGNSGMQVTTLGGAAGQAAGSATTGSGKAPPQPTVYFAFNRSHIRQKYLPQLQKVANYLSNHPHLRVRLEGNTDDRGTREYNLALGQRRSVAVAQILLLDGVSKSQLVEVSYGEENPVCTQQIPACWKKNRRVNFIYIKR